MKVTRARKTNANGISCRDVIVSEWRRLGEVSIGADELLRIQQAISEAFGKPAVESPASIARELAHEGAELRHPEVIECDARWREAQIANQLKTLGRVSVGQTAQPLRLKQAESLIKKLERLRRRFALTPDGGQLAELKTLAIDARRMAISRAKDHTLSMVRRDEQAEIAGWLMVWLETPDLFPQWLELRKSAPAFKEKFSTRD